MSTPDTLRWWGDQIRKCTREFYFSHVLVADLNYGADEIEKLQVENAKLRELVRALLTCATDGECDECRINGATPWHVGEAQLCDRVWEHLRELEIEVDE